MGAGGMAIVWRARDLRLQRPVAVKILRPELAEDEDLARRFAAEARLAASLAHQNIAPVYDTDVDGDHQFIVMELVDGPSVADLLRDQGALEPKVAVEIAAAAARALAAAHRRGLIHRDVKPANLLVGRDGRTRLADFGIARALTVSRVTKPGTVLGSVPYLSPEQARGEEATASSDIFSMGVVLFEMLTGQLPWDADTPAAMATVRLHAPAPAPSGIRRSLPKGLDAIVGRALAVDPTERYPSARVLADALEAWSRRHRSTRGARAALRGAATAAASGLTPVTASAAAAMAAGSMPGSRGVPSRSEPGAAIVGTARPNPAALKPRATSATRRGRRALEQPTAAPVGDDERSRRAELLLAALALILPLGVVIGMLSNDGPRDGAGPPGPAAVATAIPTTVLLPTAPPVSFATPIPVPIPSATVAPTPRPTQPPPVTPPPTPEPPRPTEPAAPNEPAGGGPAGSVRTFYDAVEAHDWDRAIALWSPTMRERYPPDAWLIDRFRPTTRIDITELGTVFVDRDAGRARVSVTLIEYRRVEPSPRTFVGAWDLVRMDGRWVLHDPHF
jgi:eukaryotic-like serine/threonine-protein kinase